MKRIRILQGTFWPGDLAVPGGIPWIIVNASAAIPSGTGGRQPPSALRADAPADGTAVLQRCPYQFLGACWRCDAGGAA